MSAKGTGALVALLAVLCGAYALMVHLERAGEQRAVEAKRVFGFDAADLVQLEVDRLSEEPCAARRAADGSWSMTAPLASIEANPIVWERVARALAGLLNQRTISTVANLGEYGLEEPAVTVSAKTRDGMSVAVAFGFEDPTRLNRYARLVEGGPEDVFLVDRATYHELDRPLNELRNRYVVSIGDKGITRIEFALYWQGEDDPEHDLVAGQESRQKVVAVRSEGEPWWLLEPIEG
ncbi:MAG TPA: DUF4340 domain-containing protein, partial [Candidatus Hydrogenedentes bacterium]|nr:DUF4340 domain-containing protein [Candidatus Hydrogenedentota bacterium]